MRNYVALKALKYRYSVPFFGFTVDAFAFGADEDDLMGYVNQFEAYQRANFSPHPVIFSFPNAVQVLYVLLDKLNIARIFNHDQQGFWEDSQFGIAEGTYPSGVLFPLLPDQTQFLTSPRNTFPTSLGTDGQRLRAGKASSDGSALNYLGKLFFLTGNQLFFSLWKQLKTHKITAKEALAKAEAAL